MQYVHTREYNGMKFPWYINRIEVLVAVLQELRYYCSREHNFVQSKQYKMKTLFVSLYGCVKPVSQHFYISLYQCE